MSCKCQECGKHYKVDILVDDDLWDKIRPKHKKRSAGMLCGICIMKKIESFDIYTAYELRKK